MANDMLGIENDHRRVALQVTSGHNARALSMNAESSAFMPTLKPKTNFFQVEDDIGDIFDHVLKSGKLVQSALIRALCTSLPLLRTWSKMSPISSST